MSVLAKFIFSASFAVITVCAEIAPVCVALPAEPHLPFALVVRTLVYAAMV